MGEVTVSERKHRFVIVFVKYYCSDFILTIVFFLFCFLLVSSLVGVWKCVFLFVFACCCLNVMQDFFCYLFCIILFAVCVFLFSFSACCDRVCVCVCFCFWWREILFPLFLILFSVCECFVFCSTAVITSFSSFSFIYWY